MEALDFAWRLSESEEIDVHMVYLMRETVLVLEETVRTSPALLRIGVQDVLLDVMKGFYDDMQILVHPTNDIMWEDVHDYVEELAETLANVLNDFEDLLKGYHDYFVYTENITDAAEILQLRNIIDDYSARIRRLDARQMDLCIARYQPMRSREWKRDHRCIVCYIAPVSQINYPCNHVCLCENCMRTLIERAGNGSVRCPICRVEVVASRTLTHSDPAEQLYYAVGSFS